MNPAAPQAAAAAAQAPDAFLYIFMIFFGSAVFATLALYLRQSVMIAHILLGIALGPSGLNVISNLDLTRSIADIGIVFLLFLLGLNLQPRSLLDMGAKSSAVTLFSSVAFGIVGFGMGRLFGYDTIESLIIGVAATFSSTILGIKLLPTTVLHHRRAGEIMVSILLLQDVIAIIALFALESVGKGNAAWHNIAFTLLALPGLVGLAWLGWTYLLLPLMARFDKLQEYLFLLALGWCLGMAELSAQTGGSHAIGAFLAGVVMANNNITRFIAESLKPLRDFFLVIFFVTLGASLNLRLLPDMLLPALALAGVLLLIKPLVFDVLLRRAGEEKNSLEMGVRLGQISEFSLLIAVTAQRFSIISEAASNLIQVATLLSFIASSYFIVLHYPTPIAISDKLRRD
jgi:Kef-type K+ transport system membrane component KefB